VTATATPEAPAKPKRATRAKATNADGGEKAAPKRTTRAKATSTSSEPADAPKAPRTRTAKKKE
jgi:hypothetical protein